jgi:phospholipase/carboxylesterase
MSAKRQEPFVQPEGSGRLSARPVPRTREAPPRLHGLELAPKREGLLYVPVGYRATSPTPLVVLHGAGGNARHDLAPLLPLADAARLLLLAPTACGQRWNLLLGSLRPDLRALDRALHHTFRWYAVDPTHLPIGGFSGGASYALSVGLTNGASLPISSPSLRAL